MNWESQTLSLLAASLVRPFVLAVAAWLTIRILKVRHPASLHAVWTAVLIGMMLLPLVNLIAPRWHLPALPRSHEVSLPRHAAPVSFPATAPRESIATYSSEARPGRPGFAFPSTETLVLCCYFAGLFAVAVYRFAGWVLLRRVISRSIPLRGRRLLESADVLTPVAVGVLHPAVILPAGWRTWSASTRRAVLTHEFAHLRRNDVAVAALARVTQCLFWFHPLSWWLSRKLADLAELACDAAALERLDDPTGYARILLEFAGAVNRAGHRVVLPGLAMAANSRIGQRIDRVFELSGSLSNGRLRKLSRPRLVLALLGAPVMCLAATIALGESTAPTTLPATASGIQSPLPRFEGPLFKPPSATRIVAQQRATQQIAVRTAPTATPKFEVASIRPCRESDITAGRGKSGGGGRVRGDPGTLIAECQTLTNLIRTAYLEYPTGEPWPTDRSSGREIPPLSRRLLTQPISGGPAWVDSDRYTIEAKAEGEPSMEMMRGPLMRALLEDRFKLKIRRETKDTPVYFLTAAKGGPKLQPAKDGTCLSEKEMFANGPPPMPEPGKPLPPMQWICGAFGHSRTGEDRAYRVTLAHFSEELSRILDRDVIDKTGMFGEFDISMELTLTDLFHGLSFPPGRSPLDNLPPSDAPPEPAGSSVFAALQKLGLKLDAAKTASEFLVIDHVERPTGN